MGLPLGVAARDYATRGFVVFWVILSALLAISTVLVPREALAQATCAFGFSVPYGSGEYSYIMSETVNPEVLAACDPTYPAVSSGLAGRPQSGTSSGGGSYWAQSDFNFNIVKYTPSPTFTGADTFTLKFCKRNKLPLGP
jgi:hypothetical protein